MERKDKNTGKSVDRDKRVRDSRDESFSIERLIEKKTGLNIYRNAVSREDKYINKVVQSVRDFKGPGEDVYKSYEWIKGFSSKPSLIGYYYEIREKKGDGRLYLIGYILKEDIENWNMLIE